VSDERDSTKGDEQRRLHQVGAERELIGDSRDAEELVRASAAMPELDAADNEALIALTLGDDASAISEEERRAAASFAAAFERDVSDTGDPLVSLAWSLRAVAAADREQAVLSHADHESLLALTIGADIAVDDETRHAANALRDGLELGRGDELAGSLVALAGSLRALHAPIALAEEDHEALLAITLGEAASAVSEQQQAEAETLAEAMETAGEAPLMGLVGALRAARADTTLDPLSVERILRRVLPRRLRTAGPAGERRPVSRSMTFGALVAMAAGVALFIGSMSGLGTDPVAGRDVPQAQAGLVASFIEARSTQELFDPATPFARKGGESNRIGTIVTARAGDLRSNRFAAWGVE
jgi:hypothetical protein